MFCSQEKIEMATRVTSEAVGSSVVFFRKKYITPAFGYKVQKIRVLKKGENENEEKQRYNINSTNNNNNNSVNIGRSKYKPSNKRRFIW